jgi:ankyrin repeat protein
MWNVADAVMMRTLHQIALGDTERKVKFREILQGLPKNSRILLRRLVMLLSKISDFREINKMGATNLATVVGPNILYPQTPDPLKIVEEVQLANEIVTTIITECQYLFSDRTIIEAINNENVNSLEELYRLGASLTEPDERGRTPLHAAADNANLAIVEYLLMQPGVDVNAQDVDGVTVCRRAGQSTNLVCCILVGHSNQWLGVGVACIAGLPWNA